MVLTSSRFISVWTCCVSTAKYENCYAPPPVERLALHYLRCRQHPRLTPYRLTLHPGVRTYNHIHRLFGTLPDDHSLSSARRFELISLHCKVFWQKEVRYGLEPTTTRSSVEHTYRCTTLAPRAYRGMRYLNSVYTPNFQTRFCEVGQSDRAKQMMPSCSA